MKLFFRSHSHFADLMEFPGHWIRRILDLQYQSRCLAEKALFKDLDLKHLKVLDFGAGTQDFLVRYEFSKYHSLDPYLPAQWKNLSEIPADEIFDLVIASEVFEHLEDPAAVLKELSNLLKPGKRIYVTTPFMAREHGAPADYQRWTQKGLEKLLTEAGFKIEQSHRRGNTLAVVSALLNFSVFKLLTSPGFLVGLVLLPPALILLFLAQISLFLRFHSPVYLGLSILASKLPSKDL